MADKKEEKPEVKDSEKKPDLVAKEVKAAASPNPPLHLKNLPLPDDLKDPKAEAPKSGIAMRRSRWESSFAAVRYINSLGRDEEVKVRDSDRATTIFLLLASILTVLSLVIKPFAGMRLQFVLICDVLVGVMLIFYLANRFGIINTLTPRQALLTWQLIVGSAFLGIFMTINLAVVIGMLIANSPTIDIR
ncbi:MAG: hypothetical protein IT343_09620 [Candidatus Melainabacteria bacterium]|jgi:hypothetical protein|nr:hypothetical protein [Candidatus Melainabacteria bacterium]